jgi:hypothetical protein
LNIYFIGFFLTQFALFIFLESTEGTLDRQGRVRGRDFLQFYIAGRIVAGGDAGRLYDQDHFLEVQRSLVGINEKSPPYFSLYPPTTALLFSTLARLPYDVAILLWWLTQAICLAVVGYLLLKDAQPAANWRLTAWMALPAFYPVISTFWNGQLSALMLLVLCGGLQLHRLRWGVLAGCLFSVLSMKPQFAVGVTLWLVLRRDVRTLSGLGLGLLLQAALTATTLGPEVLVDYARNLRTYASLSQIYQYTPDHQHALPGILTDLLGGDYSRWGTILYLVVAGYSALLLFHLIRSQRRTLSPAGAGGQGCQDPWQLEQSAVVVSSLLMTPHLLTYDLSLLLIPITNLWLFRMGTNQGRKERLGIALYLFATFAPLYVLTQFSLMPFALLWVLSCLCLTRDPLSEAVLYRRVPNAPARE